MQTGEKYDHEASHRFDNTWISRMAVFNEEVQVL